MIDRLKRVFVVDDEVVVAFEMTDLLEDMGFEVVGPSVHLNDARKRAAADEFDIAFLDVNMGQQNTSEPVAKILRERNIPFVFITAYDADQIDFLKPGDCVVKKPVSTEKLFEALKNISI